MSWRYPKWLREILTEGDNITVAFERAVPLAGIVTFFGLSAWSVLVNHSPFAAAEYAQGLAIILGPSVLACAIANFRKPPNGN